MEVEFGTIMEFIVLGAIAIELVSLYLHSRFSHRIDQHILETDRNLKQYDVKIQVLSNDMSKLDERLIRLDEHINNVDDHLTRYDEHINRVDDHMTRYDEHINRLDDLLWKSYLLRTENINGNQESKD